MAKKKTTSKVTKGVKNTANQTAARDRQLSIERSAGVVSSSSPAASSSSSSSSSSQSKASSSSTTPAAVPNIAFKAGLTDTQKQSITKLATAKPVDQWTATDKANWSFATNNSALPSASPSTAPGATTPAAPTVPGAPVSYDEQEGWTDSMKQSYSALQQYVNTLTQSGKVVNPDINFDEATIARFTEQARKELGDYYDPLFRQTADDIKVGLQRMGEDMNSYTDRLAKQFGQSLEATQEDFARRGLNFSSDREKAETGLVSDFNAALASKEQETERSAFDLGTKGERTLGSSFLPSDLGSYKTGSKAQRGAPGQYGFSSSTGSRSLFSPLGGERGTLEADRKAAEENRVIELKNAKRELDANYYM